MTEAQWLACTDPERMLEFVRTRTSVRKVRLFVVACCRRIWHILTNRRARRAVEIAECLAEGRSFHEDLAEFRDRLGWVAFAPIDYGQQERSNRITLASLSAAYHALQDKRVFLGKRSPLNQADADLMKAPFFAALAVAQWQRKNDKDATHWEAYDAESKEQAELLRCIMGNVFCPVAADPAWFLRSGGRVRQVAQAIYGDRAFDHLPILADALIEAGCDQADILDHCRQGGEHVRGCWVVDLVLQKS